MNRFATRAAAMLLLTAAACGGGSHQGARIDWDGTIHAAGPSPVRVAVGDVNGDGVPDCVVLRRGNSSVALLAGARGPRQTVSLDGTYDPKPAGNRVLVWDTARDLALADINRDGALDLVVSGGAAGQVGIWLGDKANPGEFLSPQLLDAGKNPGPLAVGDFDRDGRPDIATVDEDTGHLTILRQTSALGWTVDSTPPEIGACAGLVACDLDRDGLLDLVTNRPAGQVVDVWHQSPGGVFTAKEVASGHATGRGMAVADVDGDGWLDIVVVGRNVQGGKGALVTMMQDRTAPGTFHEVDSPLAIAIDESGVHIADCDGDGAPDAILDPLDEDSDGDVLVCFGARTGSFGPDRDAFLKISNADGSRGLANAIADMDGDGLPDIVEADTAKDAVAVLLTRRVGPRQTLPLDAAQKFTIDLTGPIVDMVAADLDRDGVADLASVSSDGSVRLYFASIGSSPEPPVTLMTGSDPRGIAVADVNGDGCPDLVVTFHGTSQVAVCLRNPAVARGFNPPVLLACPVAPLGLAIGDLDGDGRPDLAVCEDASPAKVAIYRQAPGAFGVFLPAIETPVGGPACVRVAMGDVDGDGFVDLATCSDGPCRVLLRDPTGPLKWMAPEVLLLTRWTILLPGDVDGDGRIDLVGSGPDGVEVALQDPLVPGRFLPSFSISTEPAAGIALGDLDGDGRLDVCFAEPATGLVRAIDPEADGDGVEALRLNGLPPGVPVTGTLIVLEADVDGDGFDEVVVTTPGTAVVPPRITGFSPVR